MANKGVNKVIILGNLGNDPEIRYMPNGNAVVNISVATNEEWTDKNSGQKQTRTEFHRIEAFGKLAEIMGQYLRKGSQVYIEGSIRTDRYTDQQGIERFSTKIRADQMQMLGGKGDNQQAPQNNAQQQAPQGRQYQNPQMDNGDDFSDDVPF